MVSGIHHVTLITRKVQANVDFYVGFLGLRLVKRTAGFEDAAQLHLLYGDGAGSPGSLITFLVWEDGSPGRVGHGQIGEIALAIDPGSIGFWLTRALTFGLRPEGPAAEFGEPTIRLKDPDRIIVKLTGCRDVAPALPWDGMPVSSEDAIRRIRAVTLLTETPEQTQAFLADNFDYRPHSSTSAITRLISSSGDAVDIRNAQGFWSSAPGTGTADHVAFRASDRHELATVQRKLGAASTSQHDRRYFYSLYVREPGGILFELATDPPGMTVDEDIASLGTQLFVPPGTDADVADLTVVLPQFSMPGEERIVYRDLPFVHRFFTPPVSDGTVIVLFHGSGGNEISLMPLAHRIAPRATLLGLRGRSAEEGSPRWFRRSGPLSFDQQDIADEAEALAAFIEQASAAYGLKPEHTVYFGHSNGANFLGAFLLLQPRIVTRAVLLRPLPALEKAPAADLSGLAALLVAGAGDAYAAKAIDLATSLTAAGADVEKRVVQAGHDTDAADVTVVQDWLS